MDMVVGARAGATAVRKGRVLTPCYCAFGYEKVSLTCKDRRVQRNVHVLVLEAFIGPRPGRYPQVHARHLNGRKTDNRPSNLVWGTALENSRDKDVHGTMLRGSAIGTSRLLEWQVKDILTLRESNESAAKRYKVCKDHIAAIRAGRAWAHMQRKR